MKPKVIIAYVLAFVIVTGALYFMAGYFKNIFAFDFTPVSELQKAEIKKPENKIPEDKKESVVDSLEKKKLADSLSGMILTDLNGDSVKTDSKAKHEPAKVEQKPAPKVEQSKVAATPEIKNEVQQISPEEAQRLKENEEKLVEQRKRVDSTYIKRVKKNASIYEAMEPLKAAKIISNLSDNEAKDILYAMKKKKAAEVLSFLTPDAAARILK